MLKKESDINWDLIAKHLAGETCKDEEDVLTAWINGSESNRIYFARLEQWWQQTGHLSAFKKMDTEADWLKIKQQFIQHGSARKITPPHRNIFDRYSFPKAIAAVIAFLLIVGAVWYSLTESSNRQQQENAFVQINVPNGQMSQMVLADGTSVWLNSGSNLQFPANFEGGSRLVKLVGEAYFEVTPNDKKPFVVQTIGLEVKVHGTKFNVRSYANDESDEVTLLSGSVSVSGLNRNEEIFLTPNQKISYFRAEGTFTGLEPVDKFIAAAWRDGKLVFEDEPFCEIAKKLERRYGVTINVEDESICQQRYRGAFRKETLEQAIKAIQLTAKYKYKIEDDVVTIYK